MFLSGFWFGDLFYTHFHVLLLFKFCTQNHSLLQYIVFSHLLPFLLLIDPKRDMWSPELTMLTSGLILPHVPGMKRLIFICIVHIRMNSLIFCFCFQMSMSLSVKNSVKQMIHLMNHPNIHCHWHDESTGLWSHLRIIKT